MSDRLLDGGHDLPPVFSGAPAPARVSRRRRRRIVWGVLGGLVLAGAAVGVHLAANLGYDDARVDFTDAATIVENRQDDLSEETEELQLVTDTAAGIAEADSGALMPAEARETLDAAIAAVEQTTADADAAATASVPAAGEKPFWTWELFGETARLGEDGEELEAQADDIGDERRTVSDASSAVEEAAVAAMQEAAGAASEFETAHVNARNPEILMLRATADSVATSATALDDAAVSLYGELEAAAAAVLETERAELAEKEGPLEGERVEIEAFARELAPGVLLDFDWSATVPGYDGPSYGGWTTWWYGDPGYATIALSDYIAEEWPAAWTKALVAHEVGHAISVKCESMYDSSDQDTIEEWATAWAISMGYTDRANGTDVYGAPSQAMIDRAAQCR